MQTKEDAGLNLNLLIITYESAVQRYFATNSGNTVTAAAIRQQFDEAFGDGAGDKVNVCCDNSKTLITELWINLHGEINANVPIATLMQNAPAVNNVDCAKG